MNEVEPSTCSCRFQHSDACEPSQDVLAARRREMRREQNRRRAMDQIAALPPGVQDRLARDFERATREARFISERGGFR